LTEEIRVYAPSEAHGRRLVESLAGTFETTIDDRRGEWVVGITPDERTAVELVGLFDDIGQWLSAGELVECRVGFGGRDYTLLAATQVTPNDPSSFLLERSIQLEGALNRWLVVERARGVYAERYGISPEEALVQLTAEAENAGVSLTALADDVVATTSRVEN
jgi:hypothetical protein